MHGRSRSWELQACRAELLMHPTCVVSTGGRWAELSLFEVLKCLRIELRGPGSRPGRND